MGVGAGLVEVATALLMALGLTGPKKLSCPPPHSHLEEGLLIARWRVANEPAEDLGDSCDGHKGLP